MPPDLAFLPTLIGSNYPCIELILMVPMVFEPLKFDCIIILKKVKDEKKNQILLTILILVSALAVKISPPSFPETNLMELLQMDSDQTILESSAGEGAEVVRFW